ncbi:MAG: adenylate/guanylate cyclase domain-containing protein [Anaerolineae bacterium]|nr:MAG: adenylate/guanylate cyclase domain-containing protein [Anaerolineae bacterium]
MKQRARKAKGRRFTQQQRRLGQAVLVGLTVAGAISLIQWAGLFSSTQVRAADYLYDTKGEPGDDIVIVAIDERSQQSLGEWPLPITAYVSLFERLRDAKAIGFDVLLTDPGPENSPDTAMLLEAIRQAGNTIMPLTAEDLNAPQPADELYTAGRAVRPFPALLEAAAGAGAVEVALDSDTTIRRVPLLLNAEGKETWEAFSLSILRLYLGLGDTPASLASNRLVIGDERETKYEIRTDAYGTIFVNFVGPPNTFVSFSLVDVIEGQVPASALAGKIVLVGMMNTVSEMDLHRTPVSAKRMAGVEFQANAIHTLLHHRPLVRQSRAGTTITVAVLALASAVALARLKALPGALLTLLLAAGYFVLASIQFNAGRLPNVLFPYATIFLNYATLTTARFASVWTERARVTDTFGRFVSAEVRDAIVNLALEDPDLIQPGGREMEISVLFADIRGFTAMAERLTPEEVVGILNQYLDSMEEQVFKHGGTLDKYTGDGMMVLFGAPLEQPGHAARAVRAALSMQRAAAEVSQRRSDGQTEMVYGNGITTGPAVVGHIGSKRRLDYTAIGDTVNLAARLEGIAPPGVILIDRATYEATKEIALVETLEAVKVKGKARPVPVWKVLGLREGG